MQARTIFLLRAIFSGILGLAMPLAGEAQRVTLLRTPEDGIQPQAAVDASGVAHLIYFKGEPSAGDIFYVRQQTGEENFSKPLRVNRQAGSAMALGTIRGAQLAVGKNGRAHVAWDGMGKGAAPFTLVGKKVTPYLYARLNDTGTAFEAERNLITYAAGLDGGGSVAADGMGNVYAMWHAATPGNTNGEAGRSVFVARSSDDGKTFGREERVTSEATGACGCCGMKAFADHSGAVYVLYRAAGEKVNRDEVLLISPRPGADFEVMKSYKWTVPNCPMSSASLAEGNGNTLAAWETAGQVYYAAVNQKTRQISKAIAPLPGPSRKHPVAVANNKGETLFVWTENTGWAKGGAVAWQLYDKDGKATTEKGRADGVPVWSLATAFAKADGSFVIVY